MSFWAAHGYIGGFFFIMFLLLLPRLTMFVSLALTVGMVTWLTEPFGLAGHPLGVLLALAGWVAWFMFPRFLVAILATALYFESNTVLVAGAWLSAYFIFTSKKEIAAERAKKRQEEEQEEAERLAAEENTAAKKKKRARTSGTQSGQRRRPAQSTGQRVQQWWDVLGVNPSASTDAIKAAYRRIAKATHPDSAPDGKGDVEIFRKANEAYQKGLRKNGK
jgi:hypothetical protein